jgi:hypothetical protein
MALRWSTDGPAGAPTTALAEMVRKGPLAEMEQAMRAQLSADWQKLLQELEARPGGSGRAAALQRLYEHGRQLHPIGARAWSNQKSSPPDYVWLQEFARGDAALLDQITDDLEQLARSAGLEQVDLGSGVMLRILGRYGVKQLGLAHVGTSMLMCLSEPSHFGRFAAEPWPSPAGEKVLLTNRTGVAISVSLPALRAMNDHHGPGEDTLVALIDRMQGITWGVTLEGAQVRCSLLLSLPHGPPAWAQEVLAGARPGLAMASMPGELMRVESCMNVAALRKAILDLIGTAAAGKGDQALGTVMDCIEQAFDGRMTLQCAAPPGPVVPRTGLALGIRNEAAARTLIEQLTARAQEVKQVQLEGVACTTVRLGAISTLVPAFTMSDGELLVAETPATLRILLRERGKADTIGARESAPETPFGPALPGFRLRYDVGELLRMIRKIGGTLMDARMVAALRNLDPDVSAAELLGRLDDAELAAALGMGSGGIVPVEQGLLMTSTSTLGGPVTSLFLTILIPYAQAIQQSVWRGLEREMR